MPSIPPAAQPRRVVFDPWNSSTTGHQRAESRAGGSTAWQQSRTAKLGEQFADGSGGGGRRLYDLVGAGSLGFGRDGRTAAGGWDESSVRGARARAGMADAEVDRTGDLAAWLGGEGLKGGVVQEVRREREDEEAVIREEVQRARKRKRVEDERRAREAKRRAAEHEQTGRPDQQQEKEEEQEEEERHWTETVGQEGGLSLDDLPEELTRPMTARSRESAESPAREVVVEHPLGGGGGGIASAVPASAALAADDGDASARARQPPRPPASRIFASCVFYINGSTMPLVSDHRLKYMIAQHGGRTSVALGRRTVTHVVLGTPSGKGGGSGSGSGSGSGLGGGLAGGKLQREVERIGGKGVKFVSAGWVLESIKAGKRLPEAGFAALSAAPPGAHSVYGTFKQMKPAYANSSEVK